MITVNHQKESLSRSLIQAVAGRFGMICSFSAFDYGIDVRILEVATREFHGKQQYRETGFCIDIQAKSTTSVAFEPDQVVYDLDARNYNDLCDPDVGTPRILVLLVLHEDKNKWLALTERRVVMKRCAYWYSLKGKPPTKNNRRVRIRIPRQNVFDARALHDLMQRRKNGGDL